MTKRYQITRVDHLYELSEQVNYMIDHYKHVEMLGPPFFDPEGSGRWCQAMLITE